PDRGHRGGGRRECGTVRRPSRTRSRDGDAAPAARRDGAVAGVRLRARDGPRQRGGPAAQPGEVRHGGVTGAATGRVTGPATGPATGAVTVAAAAERGSAKQVIIGVGIDVAEIERFEASLERTPHLRERLFLDSELRLPDGRPRSAASLAARF